MKYAIRENPNGLGVEIEDIEGQEQHLLSEFEDCQQGRCCCPTDEYKKLDSIEITQGEGEIHLQLIAKGGQELNKEEIIRCLEHTTKTSSRENSG